MLLPAAPCRFSPPARWRAESEKLLISIAANLPKKAYKSPPMEGMLATWYAKSAANDLPDAAAMPYPAQAFDV